MMHPSRGTPWCRHIPFLLALILFQLASAASAQQSGVQSGRGLPQRSWPQTDVLVILADDIGWRDIDPSIPTPNLDRLARHGVSFQRAYSMPYCSPTRFSILFGEQPFREQLGTYIDPNLPGDVSVSPTRRCLAQAMRSQGYQTLAAGKWHLSTFAIGQPAAWEWPRRFGFDHFLAGRIGNIGGSVTYTSWPRIDDGHQSLSAEYNTSAIRRAAGAWWQAESRPKFGYVAFHAAHTPFHVPPARLLPPGTVVGPGNRSRFEAMVTAMDTEVGKLLERVDLDHTYVFFLGDNGTPPDAIAPDQIPGRVKGTVYEGGINVPLIVAGPDVPWNRTSQALVSTTDLFATILDLVGAEVPAGQAIDSVSFAHQIFDPEKLGRTWIYSQEFVPNGPAPKASNQRAVITQRFKLITDGAQSWLFDLQNDPRELSPLPKAAYAQVCAALRFAMRTMVAQGAP